MNNTKNRPTEFSPKEEWEQYLNSRIEWKIPLDEYNIEAKANISFDEVWNRWQFFVELKSQSKLKLEIKAAIYDVNNNIKYTDYLFYDTLDKFGIGSMSPQIKRLYMIDKIVIYGKIENNVE